MNGRNIYLLTHSNIFNMRGGLKSLTPCRYATLNKQTEIAQFNNIYVGARSEFH
jgi:hypothetical protein